MVEVRFGFFWRREGEFARHGTVAQAPDLREDEPHPMALLAAIAQVAFRAFKYRLLGIYKTLQIVRVAHFLFAGNW
jgi:hypothetical protein